MSSKTISVIMPNYNHGHYIGEALESILSQSFKPAEVIVIDDASTDNSIEIIESIIRRDSTVKLLRNELNVGPLVATNSALGLITSEYVYAMAADDKILPAFFEKSINLLKQYPQAGLCSTDMSHVDAEGNYIDDYHAAAISQAAFLSPSEVLAELYKTPNYIIGGTTIFRRAALEEVGGFRLELLSLCDWFAERAIALKYGACYIPEALFLWRQTGSNYSGATFNNVQQMLEAVAHTIKLMRSATYREFFPSDFVSFWHKWYVDQVISNLDGRLEQHLSAFLHELRKCGAWLKVTDKIFWRLIQMLTRAAMLLSRTYLERVYLRQHKRQVLRESENL